MLDTEGKAYVVLYQHNDNNKKWDKIKTSIVTDEKIAVEIDKYLKMMGETMGFYRFDCYDSEGVFRGTLYTTHIWLFD